MLCGNCPPMLVCGVLRLDNVGVGAIGLRAFCTKLRGVEEAVMDVVPLGSDIDRRDGTLGVLEASNEGLPNGDSSSSSVDSGDRGLVAKSIDSSGALGGLSGGAAIAACPESLFAWHERTRDRPVLKS
jgi:hypothetical protein